METASWIMTSSRGSRKQQIYEILAIVSVAAAELTDLDVPCTYLAQNNGPKPLSRAQNAVVVRMVVGSLQQSCFPFGG